jgi:hypothetical protein
VVPGDAVQLAQVLQVAEGLEGGLEVWTACDNRPFGADDFELVTLLLQALIEQVPCLKP